PTPDSITGKVMSPLADLPTVAAHGRVTGEVFRSMLYNPETSAGALPYLYTTLWRNLGHGGTYDYQRRGDMITGHLTGFTQLPQLRPIANVNGGLFAQQAGLTLDEALGIAGFFAKHFSRNADPSQPNNLAPLTAHFIKRGYELGQSGMFDKPPMP